MALIIFWLCWLIPGFYVAWNSGCVGDGCLRDGFDVGPFTGSVIYAAVTSVPYMVTGLFSLRVPRVPSTIALVSIGIATWIATFLLWASAPEAIFGTLLIPATVLVTSGMAGITALVRVRSGTIQ